MKQFVQIHWTCPNFEEARKVSKQVVENKLAACGQIIPQIESTFLWKDKIEIQKECMVIFKTTSDKFEEIKRVILTPVLDKRRREKRTFWRSSSEKWFESNALTTVLTTFWPFSRRISSKICTFLECAYPKLALY